MLITIREYNDHLMILWCRLICPYIQYAGFRHEYLKNSLLFCHRILNCDHRVILEHPDCHRIIIYALAFNVIHGITDPDKGISRDTILILLMFIAKLHDLFIQRIICTKYFVDQWDQQFRHLLCHCPKSPVEWLIAALSFDFNIF